MISSLTNERIKEINKLKDKKYRNEVGLFVVEGLHLVEEAEKAGALVEVFTTEDDIKGTKVSEAVMKKLASTTNVPKVLSLCKIIKREELSDKVLLLDDISDPTNLGTILRSAKSFGFNTVIASLNSVDFYNDKVIRGSQGAIFKLNLISSNLDLKIDELKQKGYLVYGTNVREGIDVSNAKIENKVALILGNETRGLDIKLANKCDKNIYIKLDDMESLNVSVAGSILMYEISKKRLK